MTYRRKIVRGSVMTFAALGIAAIVAVSPPTSTQAKPPAGASARDELRAKIATLRGEIGLLNLEHEADRASLVNALAFHYSYSSFNPPDNGDDAANSDREFVRRKIAYKDRITQMAAKELLLEDALKRYREAE